MRHRPVLSALLAAALLLTAVAWLRGAEYDEQYTLFLTGREARPTWPAEEITAGDVKALQARTAGFTDIALDLRATDVHPPLYFWVVSAWRGVVGQSLFIARLASVLCSVATLSLVALIARSCSISAASAVLLTVGCYGFAYTGSIARGFALAQLLSVAGIAFLVAANGRGGRMLAAGLLLGAATFTNYLALFIACAALLHGLGIGKGGRGRIGGGLLLLGIVAWLPADLWFYLAQRHSRTGQFEVFEPSAATARLAQYAAANILGGLPLYTHGMARILVVAASASLLLAALFTVVRRWSHIATPASRELFAMAATAPPVGLLLLGVTFNNAPIELRYLALATPFVGLLLAAALPRWLRHLTLAVQALALLGLTLRPETMQPARAAARAAVSLVADGVALVPRGNDGVGIVGAFATEVPASMRILVIGGDLTVAQIRARTTGYHRVVLTLLDQDATSRTTLSVMRGAFTDPCWREVAGADKVLAFDWVCQNTGSP